MTQYVHGGDIRTYGNVLDFSANINPLGIPEAVKTAARDAIDEAVHYPDPFCREIRKKISERDNVAFENIICGNGAADIIFKLCLAKKPKKAIITAPTFAEYEEALSLVGCEIDIHALNPEQNFALGEDYLEKLNSDIDIIFLCTPNNPTGRLIDRKLVDKIAEKCLKNNITFVLDECFLELCDDTSGFAYIINNNPNVVLLRAFTKSFGMPGLRFGYALCSDQKLLEEIAKCGQPWSVSTVAQAAAVAACDSTEWADRGRELIQKERPILIEKMRKIGLTVWDAQANYILFRADGICDLREKMVEKGVLIRSCGNYRTLTNEYYRIAVRTAEENKKCVAVMEEVLKNG